MLATHYMYTQALSNSVINTHFALSTTRADGMRKIIILLHLSNSEPLTPLFQTLP